MSGGTPVMLGLELPDVDRWSERVSVALGQNPSAFTGPGTNTYLVGTGRDRILLDTGQGLPEYLPVLDEALELCGCRIEQVVLTHGHVDHIGGVPALLERHGPLRVSKRTHTGMDAEWSFEITAIDHGSRIETEGATLRALHTPGHAEDHLCFLLEEEGAVFSGDNVLGVGTTVIPPVGGDLFDYMASLELLLELEPPVIYPAHGPRIADGSGKLREYIDHRGEREAQILEALAAGLERIPELVARIYAAYPQALHAAAGSSVCAHLLKLEREGRVRREGELPLEARWETR